jgi:hypothetical protein
MNVRLVKFCAQPSTFAICRAYPEEGWRSRCLRWPQMAPNDPKWPFLRTLLGPHITKHQRNRGNFWNNGPKVTLFWPKMTTFGVILRTFLNPTSPNTNGIGGTFEIMAQKDLPNDPKMTIPGSLFEPHITKHQRNRGNFWNNGPKGPCFSPKPCRFYWYLAKIRPKSALNDPKSDSKLSTCCFWVVQNNEIFAPNLDRDAEKKVVHHGNIKHT